MRVAIDATPLIGERTGVGVFTAGVIGGLARRTDVEMIAYAVSWRGRHALDGLPPGVRTSRVPMAARPLHHAWRRLDGPVVEWWTGRVDVVHGTNFVVPPTHRAAQVVSVHDLTAIRFPELCEPPTLQFPNLIRRALRRGAMVHTDSRAVAAEVVELLGAPEERVRTVPCGVDAQTLPEWAPPLPGPTGRPYVLALGKTEPRKDLPSLVRAFDALAGAHPDLELVIAGPAGWAEDRLKATIEQAHHRDRVRRIGWVTSPERTTLLRNAAAFAYPSIYEGFGLPPLEAMAVGVPVVTTDAGAIPEVVSDAAKIVPVGDADALARGLEAVLDDEAERARLIEAGRLRAAHFTWERCAAGLHDLYRDAIALKTG
ncbi:MAG TPA: glycosyltransferase family 1 protein [Acidimicrobiales bacterium]|nr:glycosyltransferase family 1 protein [Acidimicrobiales bacterium]